MFRMYISNSISKPVYRIIIHYGSIYAIHNHDLLFPQMIITLPPCQTIELVGQGLNYKGPRDAPTYNMYNTAAWPWALYHHINIQWQICVISIWQQREDRNQKNSIFQYGSSIIFLNKISITTSLQFTKICAGLGICSFAHRLSLICSFAHLLICSFRSNQMSDCERFTQIAQDK